MTIRFYCIVLLATLHLSLVSVKAFRNLLGWDQWLTQHPRVAQVVEYYSQVTVMQADYSFFSPNVASDLKVEVTVEDSQGQHVINPFRISNTAVNTRFQCSIIGFQSIPAAQELIARSWAARAYEKYPTARSVSVKGSMYYLPTLREYQRGKATLLREGIRDFFFYLTRPELIPRRLQLISIMKIRALLPQVQLSGDTRPLAFLRIATGVVVLLELLTLWPSIQDIYGSHGYIEWVISQNLFSLPQLPTMAGIFAWLNPEVVTADAVLYGTLGVYIASLIGMVLGYRANVMAFIAWALHLVINNSANMYGYGVESFIHISLFYLIFMPTTAHWAIRRPDSQRAENAGRYAGLWLTILRIHLCIVYLNAGVAKFLGQDWISGEAIWRTLAQPTYAQFDMFWIAYVPWLSVIATWSVLLLETAYPVFIWFPAIRRYWLAATISMHLGIGLLMGLHAFAGIMIVLNITAFGWPYLAIIYTRSREKLAHLRWLSRGIMEKA